MNVKVAAFTVSEKSSNIWCVDYKGIVRPLIWHRHTHARMHVHTHARLRYKKLIIENACKTKTVSDLLYNK